ncbi:ubiquitin-protein transferase activity protein [Coemansia sp. RSA 2598]|nr:ubiquitin-protein transferase activity protein [Coemansia sp. RSA 2598]
MLHIPDLFLGIYNRRRNRHAKHGVLTEADLGMLPKFKLTAESISDIRRAPCRRRKLVRSNVIEPLQLPTPPEPAHLTSPAYGQPSLGDTIDLRSFQNAIVANANANACARAAADDADDFEAEWPGEDPSCVVCLEEYNVDDIVRVLPCGHVFHNDCICPWLLRRKTKFHECPICKTPCFSDEIKKKAREEEELARARTQESHPTNLVSVF